MKGQSPASAPNCLDFSRSSVSAPDEALRTMSCSLYTFRQWFLAAQARRVKGTDWPHGGIVRGGMERATGIEPVSSAWKAEVLPLHNARSARYALFHGPPDVKYLLYNREGNSMTKPQAVIIGVGDGLSAAVARELAADHASTLAARSQNKMQALADEIRAHTVLLDATEEAAV